MRLLGFVVASAVGVLAIQGCASDASPASSTASESFAERQPAHFAANAINVDQGFANSVNVEDDRLVVPTSSNARVLSRIGVGAIVAGNRDARTADLNTSKNPYGFLRRVTEISVEGETTVLRTEKAELSDWIDDGDLFFNDRTSPFEGAPVPSGLAPRNLEIQGGNDEPTTGSGSGSAGVDTSLEGDEVESADGKVKVKPFVRLNNATVSLNAKYDGHFRVRKTAAVPHKAEFRSHLTLDPVIAADIQAGVALGSVGGNPATPVTISLWEKTWRGNNVLVPIGGPIPITVRFTPELHCKVSAGGVVVAKVHAELKAHAVVGFDGHASTTDFDWNNLSETPSIDPKLSFVGVEGKAQMATECELLAVASVLAFDSAGLEGKIGPRVSLNGNVCGAYDHQTKTYAGDFNLVEQHELVSAFAARVQVPVLGIGKSFPLHVLEGLKSEPHYLVGNKETCE